jgi:Trypsin-like peptidase domain
MKKQFPRIYRYLSRPCEGSEGKDGAYRQGPARSLAFNLGIACCLAVAALATFGQAHAQSSDDSLRIYAVNIVHDPPQSWTGYGIYLGRGLVITAAHVVGSAAHTNPSVRIAGMDLPAKAIKEGSVERVDLTLLSIDTQKLPIYLQMRRMPLCEKPPWAGEPVIVAVPEGTARSRIMSPQLLPPDVRTKFPTLISDVATTGNSGSGVFDAGNKCLLGIMSRKISARPTSADKESEQKDIAKYFVPASMIRAFIPTEYPF